MSHQYEHQQANEMYRATANDVKCYPCGYSGSNAIPQPDILLTHGTENYAIEAKGPIQSDQCRIEQDDIEQLLDCRGPFTEVVLVVKFSRREPLVVRFFEKLRGGQRDVFDGDYDTLTPAKKFAALTPTAFNPHVTDSGALVLDKPSTDRWPSATSGVEDHHAILSGLGVASEKSVSVEDL
jgi:Holliday junction resolvase